jgi:hypothetical protein
MPRLHYVNSDLRKREAKRRLDAWTIKKIARRICEANALFQFILRDIKRKHFLGIRRAIIFRRYKSSIIGRLYSVCKDLTDFKLKTSTQTIGCCLNFRMQNDMIEYNKSFTRDEFNQIISRVEVERDRLRYESPEHGKPLYYLERVRVHDTDLNPLR